MSHHKANQRKPDQPSHNPYEPPVQRQITTVAHSEKRLGVLALAIRGSLIGCLALQLSMLVVGHMGQLSYPEAVIYELFILIYPALLAFWFGCVRRSVFISLGLFVSLVSIWGINRFLLPGADTGMRDLFAAMILGAICCVIVGKKPQDSTVGFRAFKGSMSVVFFLGLIGITFAVAVNLVEAVLWPIMGIPAESEDRLAIFISVAVSSGVFLPLLHAAAEILKKDEPDVA